MITDTYTSRRISVKIIMNNMYTDIRAHKQHTHTHTHTHISHILRRNCLLKHVIEGKIEGRIEVVWRRGRRRKQLLDDLKEKRGYWKFKVEGLDRTLWKMRFGRGNRPVWRRQQYDEWQTDRSLCTCVCMSVCVYTHTHTYDIHEHPQ